MNGFNFIIDDPVQLGRIEAIFTRFENPEDINGGVNTAPSKRLEAIFPYKKVHDSELILTEVGIAEIRLKCPRFNNWVQFILDYKYKV